MSDKTLSYPVIDLSCITSTIEANSPWEYAIEDRVAKLEETQFSTVQTSSVMPILFTKSEAAIMLSVSVRTVDTLISSGELRPVKVRSATRFTMERINQYLLYITSK